MKNTKITPFNPIDFLKDNEEIAEYLTKRVKTPTPFRSGCLALSNHKKSQDTLR